jgi:hypothetical protein
VRNGQMYYPFTYDHRLRASSARDLLMGPLRQCADGRAISPQADARASSRSAVHGRALTPYLRVAPWRPSVMVRARLRFAQRRIRSAQCLAAGVSSEGTAVPVALSASHAMPPGSPALGQTILARIGLPVRPGLSV